MSRHWSPPQRGARRRSQISFSWSEIPAVLGGVFLGLAYVFVPSGGAASGEAASGTGAYAAGGARVTDPWAASIVDGDTVRYRGDKYRIAHIYTPEVNGRCAYETELAARATDRMSLSAPFS